MARRYDDEFPADPAGYDASFHEWVRPGYGRHLHGHGRGLYGYGRHLAESSGDFAAYGSDFEGSGVDLSSYEDDLLGSSRDFTEYDSDFTSYDRDLAAYGSDYEPFGGYGGALDQPRSSGWHRRRLVPRPDRRYRGSPAGAGDRGWPGETRDNQYRVSRGYSGPAFRGIHRRQPYPAGERHDRRGPPDYWRYLDEDEYGLGPGRVYDRAFREKRFRRGPLGPRNALFGGEGFRRYDTEYLE